MRVQKLSDHVAQRVQEAHSQREAAWRSAIEQWQRDLRLRDETIQDRALALREAWRARDVFGATVALWKWWRARRTVVAPIPEMAPTTDLEARFSAGAQGEQRVLSALSVLLDDQWTALLGYFNHGGETDLLLVGPTAVAAVEVKNIRGTVHIDQGHWSRDKVDRHQNVVETGKAIVDAGGRSPAEQVNAVADAIQAQLRRRGVRLRVRRIVVLAHEASRIGRVQEAGVDLVTVAASEDFGDQVLGVLQPAAGVQDLDVGRIEQIVAADHAFHTAKRHQRLGQTASRTPGSGGVQAPLRPATQATRKPLSPSNQALSLQPPTSEALQDPSPLELRQAEILARDILLLSASKVQDRGLLRTVRQTISGHLARAGLHRVLSLARAALREPAAVDLLKDLTRQCRASFDLGDRVLTAIVVPLAFRWQASPGVETPALLLQADRASLGIPAIRIGSALDADYVRFSARIYAGGRLAALDPRLLRQALEQIESGREPSVPELHPLSLAPSADGSWRVVYLLGVVVTDAETEIDLNDESVQRPLAGQLDLLADAVAGAVDNLSRTRATAQSVVEGVWCLPEGLDHGRKLQQEQTLHTLFRPGQQPAEELRCFYAVDSDGMQIRLLVHWGDSRHEHGFTVLRGAQPLTEFRLMLDEAIAAKVPGWVKVTVSQLDQYDYRRAAKQLGQSWLSQSDGDRPGSTGSAGGPSEEILPR